MNFATGERLLHSYMKWNLPWCSSSDIFNKELLEFSKTANLFKDVPFSLPNVWKLIYAKYPDAKFILSVRDSPEQWYKSITNFHATFATLTSWDTINEDNYCYPKTDDNNSFLHDYMKIINGNSIKPYDKVNLINSYNKHNSEVTEFFKDKPNFITINVAKDNDYARLCKFLGVESELTKFLHMRGNITKPKSGTKTIPLCW
jgi:hypothetical protein